ncbi:LysR family transcriptional regulator [Lysinibacillus sp. SGAir0095]|uniref:LysR family transcriptional regulator n=1 Tax=Lysinibacillus sp. SGAir0095 TaxID=2070463 RepID=UPI0010CCD517|nr:LysR family transcriptional regulator [Lysinibacillus sp. SGAir0095]QCR32444.1 transcriptional regulator [Lysinibacillus sp. SGAir0095]
MNAYHAFIKVIEKGNFTKAAEELGYTQSAISQMVNSLEKELSTTLILRSRNGITLTPDGEEFLPYIRNLSNSHLELLVKQKEMKGLQSGLIRIGTFSSVACHWLPKLIKDFKQLYPAVHFKIYQGEYTVISNWIREGFVDFGFVNPDAAKNLKTLPLREDEMLAVLPKDNPLTTKSQVTLKELSEEPFILLDEGEINVALSIFSENQFEPNIQFHVHDDYAIMSMIEQGLGISILPKLVLDRCPYGIVTKSISPTISRTISLSYKDKRVLPIASRYFIDFILESLKK